MATDPEADKRLVYQQLCDSYHRVDNLRTELLGLLPLATAGGIFLLLGQKDYTTSAGTADPTLVAVGVFGFLVTIGLFAYELQGIKRCGLLRKAGQEIEAAFGLKGAFVAVPSPYVAGFIGAPLAACIIYSAVLAAWTFVALVSVSIMAALLISILIFGLSLRVSYTLVKRERVSGNTPLMLQRLLGSIVMGKLDEEVVGYFDDMLHDNNDELPREVAHYDMLIRAYVGAAGTDDAVDYLRDLVKGMVP